MGQSRSLHALAMSRGRTPVPSSQEPVGAVGGPGPAEPRRGRGGGEGHGPLSRRGGAGRGGSAGPARGVGRCGPGRVRHCARHSARRAGRRSDLRRAAFGS